MLGIQKWPDIASVCKKYNKVMMEVCIAFQHNTKGLDLILFVGVRFLTYRNMTRNLPLRAQLSR